MVRPPARPVCQHRLTSGRSTRQMWARWQGQWQILAVVKMFNSEYRFYYISFILCIWSSDFLPVKPFRAKRDRKKEKGIRIKMIFYCHYNQVQWHFARITQHHYGLLVYLWLCVGQTVHYLDSLLEGNHKRELCEDGQMSLFRHRQLWRL